MSTIGVIAKRELQGYFSTPIAYIFIIVFLLMMGALTFYVGGFFQRNTASLDSFFLFHPWLYLFLLPALSMRLWAEERKSGNIELLMTLPINPLEAVLGKFFASWIFAGIALLLSFPMVLTVNILGTPDNGVIFSGYLGSFLMAGAMLSIGSCISAANKNQIIAFVLAMAVGFLYTMSGMDMVLEYIRQLMPAFVVDMVSSLSFMTHFELFSKGVVALDSVLFFLSTMVFWLFGTYWMLHAKKA